ncbi:MAG: hypothetical protein ACXACP_08805 [Candidatus Hodarchaeales archaeon]|jgi:hypothetical protein
MSDKPNPIHPAPLMRFIIELTTWTWLLVIGLTFFNVTFITQKENPIGESWIYLLLLLLSLFLLSQFNFPGDKKPHGKMVSGTIRIAVEFFSASLGIIAAWVLFGMIGIVLQTVISVIAFYLDRDRWRWMLGQLKIPPDYVIALGYYQG